jgi:hypothetical protein
MVAYCTRQTIDLCCFLTILTACPDNCEECTGDISVSADANIATPEVRTCTTGKCTSGYYWDTTNKACTSKYCYNIYTYILADKCTRSTFMMGN